MWIVRFAPIFFGLVGAGGILAVANACDSFDADTPVVTDGATPDQLTTTDATTPPPDQDAGAVVTCVPQPIEPNDAGEDAHCGPQGQEVDLGTAGAHCGRCNHACPSGTCTSGHCPIDLINDMTTYVAVQGAGGGGVYYVTQVNNCDQSALKHIATNSMSPTTLYAAAGGVCISNARFGGDAVYAYISSNDERNGIASIRADGGAGPRYISGKVNADGLALVGDRVFYSSGRFVASIAKEGTPDGGEDMRSIHDDPTTTRVVGLVSDGARAFYATHTADDNAGARIWGRGPLVGDSSLLLAKTARVVALAVDATHVYAALENGGVVRVAKSGGDPEPVTRIFGDEPFLRGLAVGAEEVFLISARYAPGNATPMQLWRAPKCGGSARPVARSEVQREGLVLEGPHLHWTPPSKIVRMAP